MESYIEKDCFIEHEGRKVESGGALVTPDFIVAYLGKEGKLTDWHGNVLGSYRVRSTWSTPRSFVSSTMSSIEAYVDHVKYFGRSAGIGMIFKGKKAKS